MKDVFDSVQDHFPISTIQAASTIGKMLKQANASLDDFINFVDETNKMLKWTRIEVAKKIASDRKNIKMNAKRCPDCGAFMQIFPVNTTPRNQVGGNYKCAWACYDAMNCGKEIYSENTLESEIEKAGMSDLYNEAVRSKEARRTLKARKIRARAAVKSGIAPLRLPDNC